MGKCAMAFEDFVQCAALTCASCNIGFCAKCIRYFSADAHEHVKRCTDGGVLPADDNYFISMDSWHHNNLRRAKQQVQEYLETLEPDIRKATIRACRFDFLGRPGGDLI